MNLKSYLKGLGIGIIVTALILTIAHAFEDKGMTDSDVIKRAKELGLVESVTLTPSSLNNDSSNVDNDNSLEDESSNMDDLLNIEDGKADSDSADSLNNNSDVINNNELNDKSEKETDINNNSENEAQKDSKYNNETSENIEEMVIITINSGEGSEIVAGKVREAGFTDDGAAFNKYLVENGYDKKLKVGNHEIPKESSFEEIAKLLCGIE